MRARTTMPATMRGSALLSSAATGSVTSVGWVVEAGGRVVEAVGRVVVVATDRKSTRLNSSHK
jgi:hypothetical protein